MAIVNGRTETNRIQPMVPRFFINSMNFYLQDELIRDIYLHNVASVDGYAVTHENKNILRRIVKKLLTLSQPTKVVKFVPVSGATEMRVGFMFWSDLYVFNLRWAALLGNNLHYFGEMVESSDDDPWAKVSLCARGVDGTMQEDGTWVDYEAPGSGEGYYFMDPDTNPYDGNTLDMICTEGSGDIDTASGQHTPGKAGSVIYNFAYQSTMYNLEPPDDWEDSDGDYITDYGDETAKQNTVYLKIEHNSEAYGGSTLDDHIGDATRSGWFELASFPMGDTWISPHPVDLDASFTQEFDGVTTRRGVNGTSISNRTHRAPPGFGVYDSWTAGYTWGGHFRQRMGRRRWSMKLSYLSESHLTGDPDGNMKSWNPSYKDQAEAQNFFNRVANYTLGSHLPFLFQPNLYSRDYALCRFDQDEFSVSQSGPNLWTLPLEIVESW